MKKLFIILLFVIGLSACEVDLKEQGFNYIVIDTVTIYRNNITSNPNGSYSLIIKMDSSYYVAYINHGKLIQINQKLKHIKEK